MTYASTSIDRRADYYVRAAAVIAADPLDFYTRAERGRRFQASRPTARPLPSPAVAPSPSTPPVKLLAWRSESRGQVQSWPGHEGVAA